MRLSDAGPSVLNYSCLHVTLRNLPVERCINKRGTESGKKEGRGRHALDEMSYEIKDFSSAD